MGENAVLSAVAEVLPLLRERAQQVEDDRRLSEETIKDLVETGVFRLLQPKRYGGYEADPVIFYSAIRQIASACGSTGWVASVIGVHPWQLALFAASAQDEVWGPDSNTRMSSSYVPTGKVVPVDGGFQLSGRWSFSSGCDHAEWVLLGGLVPGEPGQPPDFRTFLVPRSDYAIDDVWDTVGLRGTGSNDIVMAGAFVPVHRTLRAQDTLRCYGPGQEVNPAPLYRLPFGGVFSYSITTPIIGMATGAYQAHLEHTRRRIRASYGVKAAEDPFGQVRIAEAASEIDAAWAQLERHMTEMTRLVTAGEAIPMPLRLAVRRDQVRGTGRAIEAVDRLFQAAGGRALRVGTPIQRFWRDAHAGRVHAINDPERALSMYGAGELGLPIYDGMV